MIYKPSSVFVQYAYREYRIHLFSSPVVIAVFAAKHTVNRSSAATRWPARVSASKCALVASHRQGGRRSRDSST